MNQIEATDVEASLQAIAATYARDSHDPSIAVADGHGLRVDVRNGHLEIHDGVGEFRRVRRYSRAMRELSRVVVLGSSGSLTLRAIQFCNRAGIAIAVVDPADGAVIMTSASCSLNDGRVRRAQGVALYNETGLSVAKLLIGRKLRGQADVAERELCDVDAADAILETASGIEDCESVDEVLIAETGGANRYWLSWEENVMMTFTKRDLPFVADHWLRFSGRKSTVSGTNRSATSPIAACQNLLYRFAEIECRLSILKLGLDPSLGVIHGGRRNYDGFVYDCMEPARVVADRYLARLLRHHVFQRRRDFSEDDSGTVRVLSPLSHDLASVMPSFAMELGPVLEEVASLFAQSSGYEMSVPTRLSGRKQREAARVRRQLASGTATEGTGPAKAPAKRTHSVQPPRARSKASALPPPACKVCGMILEREASRPRRRGAYCPDCLAERRRELGTQVRELGTAASAPGPKTRSRQSTANSEQRLAEQRWELEHEGEAPDREWYLRVVLPRLASVTTTAIAKATGMSTSAASKIRSGKRVPHPRHWAGLRSIST